MIWRVEGVDNDKISTYQIHPIHLHISVGGLTKELMCIFPIIVRQTTCLENLTLLLLVYDHNAP